MKTIVPIQEDKISEIVIDLNSKKTNSINEGGFLRIFGWAVEKILGQMFGGGSIPVKIKGNPAQVESFANTLAREKRYMDSWRTHGLDSPSTYRDKALLDRQVAEFERLTGLDWPFQ